MSFYTFPEEKEVPNGAFRVLKPIRADLRAEISAWRLLVWAYRDEALRAATNGSDFAGAATGYAQVNAERVGPRGSINGLLEAHEDAFAVDAKVSAWFEGVDRNWRDLLAAYCEKAKAPPSAAELSPMRLVPRLRPNGSLWLEYPVRGRNEPYLCLVDYEGHSEQELRRVQDFRDLVDALLDIMPGWTLTKWKVTSRGLTRGGESLTT